jgi:hypothetical protein
MPHADWIPAIATSTIKQGKNQAGERIWSNGQKRSTRAIAGKKPDNGGKWV